MPIYDYACAACGNRVEALHGRDEPGPATCGVCGAPMRKLVSAAAIVFKGAGWAKRDRAASTASKDGAEPGRSDKEAKPEKVGEAASSSDDSSGAPATDPGKAAETKPAAGGPDRTGPAAPATGSSRTGATGAAGRAGRAGSTRSPGDAPPR